MKINRHTSGPGTGIIQILDATPKPLTVHVDGKTVMVDTQRDTRTDDMLEERWPGRKKVRVEYGEVWLE